MAEGQYAGVNGVRLYYETHGAGDALVLLHGAFGSTLSWEAQVPALAEHHRLFVVDERGRGRSPDVEGPLTYQLMADDTIAFIEQVVQEPAHIVGASDGGIIGLFVAMQRQGLVRKLVAIGANFHRDGLLSDSAFTESRPEDGEWAMPRGRYATLSPDGPDHWPVIFQKVQRMASDEPLLTVADIAGIPVPVLVMAGDDDVILPAHTQALYEALPQGQLAVVPGTSHACFMEKPDLVNRLVLDFLGDEGPPVTFLPVRRAWAGGNGAAE